MKLSVLLLGVALASGCASPNSQVLAGGGQVELRSMQSRAFDTSDKNMVVRNVISTMQDLSFVIDKADEELGTVSGTKLGGYQIRMTVTARPRNESQMLVRANAQYNLKPIEDPLVYQDFFDALGKSLFLAANAVE